MSVVGEAALSAFFRVLFNKFSSTEFKLATTKQVRQEIENWEQIWNDIRHVLADAEGRQMIEEAVKDWYADLQCLAYDVDDILDEFATEALGHKLMRDYQATTSKVHKFISTLPSVLHPIVIRFNNKMMSKIKDISKRLKQLEARKGNLQLIGVRESVMVPNRSPSTSLVNEADVCGRDKDKKKILDLLLSDDGSDGGVSVIPIVGMGGIGKTTLAQLVYHESKYHFDIHAWACVSEEFDIINVTKIILQSISRQPCHSNDLNFLQEILKDELSGKKFLIVLDDIWNNSYDDWTKLQSPFVAGASGSKIIVTTRNYDVSSIMKTVPDFSLQKLSEHDSLSLLAHHALGARDFNGHLHLKEIGMEIVKKCDGLPLATKAIGGLLRGRMGRDEWKDILESEIWDSPEENNCIIPALKLSYYHLSSQLKQCFAYCSIVPKDYEFEEDEIVVLWMAEGFLNGANTKRESEHLGRRCFKELVSRSFFQVSSTKKSHFVMHDLINDLARSIAGKVCFRMEGHEQMKFSRDIRHSSYIMGRFDGMKNFESFSDAKHLRTFLPSRMMPYGPWFLSNNVLNDLLPRFKCIRVLSLKRYHITEIPSSIGNLKHLRYLDFSYTLIKGLPDSICTLYNLETLLLRYCEKIEKLPSKMEILDNLCYLDIEGAKSLKEMPSEIGKLTNLPSLSNFIMGQCDGLNIREMKNLSNLKGQLSISELQNVNEVQFAWEAQLSSKSNLDRLKLKWSKDFDENLRKNDVEREVLNLLRPHEELKVLAIEYYAGIAFSTWIEDPSFKNLQSLKFEDCRNCRLLPAVGKLPLLKDLYIKGMSSIISVGYEFYGENLSNVFPSLETLHFENMPEWKEWKPCEVGEQGRKFYCLRELIILNCPKLVGTLPDGLHSLKKLVIYACEELVVSVSNLPMLCDLAIGGCKEVMLGSYNELWSVKKIALSNVAKFACVTNEMRMIGSVKVEDLRINGCEELASLWQMKWGWLAPLRSLRNLRFENCAQVGSIGTAKEEGKTEFLQLDIPCNIEHLRMDHSEGLKKLPTTLYNLMCLRKLEIVKCPKLVSLLTGNLPPTLKSLVIEKCKNLQCLFDDRESINFRSTSLLESLQIKRCEALKSLSSSGLLPMGLKSLDILWCPELEVVVREIGDNTCLESIKIRKCENIKYLPQRLDKLGRLREIRIHKCLNLVCFPESGLPTANLKYLRLSECENLETLPNNLYSLQELSIWECPRVTSIPEGALPTNLKILDLIGCENLEALPNNLYSLQRLWIEKCARVTSIPEGGLPTNLTSLSIYEPNLSKAVMEWGLHRLTSLTDLLIDGSNCIDAVLFPLPYSLIDLEIKNFKNLRKLSSNGFQNLTSLQSLTIRNCPKLKSLPKKEMLASILELRIEDCPVLKKRCKRDKGKQWSDIAHIPSVYIDRQFIY